MRAGFGALQRVAAAYPPGEYRAGFLAALDAVRVLFDIKADGLADLPPAVVDAVRVLPPAPAQQLGTVGGRQFRIEGHRETAPALAAPAAVALPDLAADDPPPAGWRRLNVAPVVPVDVAEADRVVEVLRENNHISVRPDMWRLVGVGAQGWAYDEIAGPGRLILPADHWLPVPPQWRSRLMLVPVPDTWAVFVPISMIRVEARESLPDGRQQLRG